MFLLPKDVGLSPAGPGRFKCILGRRVLLAALVGDALREDDSALHSTYTTAYICADICKLGCAVALH